MHRASEIDELSWWIDPPMMQVATVKKAVRNAWKRKFGSICQICGVVMHFEIKFRDSHKYATIDHIIARCLGGTNHLSNIQVVCKKCNNEKSADESPEKQD